MANIKIPLLNPVKYNAVNPVSVPQYVSKHMEKYSYNKSRSIWTQGDYAQLWQTTDRIVQQFTSAVGPIQLDILNEAGQVVLTDGADQQFQNEDNMAEWVYGVETELSNFAPGIYFFRLTIGTSSPSVLISEPQLFCLSVPNSLYLEYSNRYLYGGLHYVTPTGERQTFSMRLLGEVKLVSGDSDDTIYRNQKSNETLIYSSPSELYEWRVGYPYGIPDYLHKRLNRIAGCSSLQLDGIYYTKDEGAKWEEDSYDAYALRNWRINVRESLYKDYQTYENSVLQVQRSTIIVGVDTDTFGAGGGVVPILDAE